MLRSCLSTEGRLPPKVVFHRSSSSTEGRLPLKVVFHRRIFRGWTHPQCDPTNRPTHGGGDAPTVLPNERTHRGGGTHPQCNPRNGHTTDRQTDRMTKPLIGARATALPKNVPKSGKSGFVRQFVLSKKETSTIFNSTNRLCHP